MALGGGAWQVQNKALPGYYVNFSSVPRASAALQNDWGVAKPEELIGKLLIGGEFDDYVTEVFQINGFKSEDDLVDEAKN